MSENSWTLRGVDPESRRAAMDEAERRGITLAELLTEVLLGGPQPETGEGAAPEIDPATTALFAAPSPSRENLAFRRRIEALERRLASAVGGLDAAVQELDAAVIGAVARLDETEAVTGETAETLRYALAELGGNVAALRKRLTDIEDGAEALIESNDDAHADLNQRCETLETRLAEIGLIAQGAAAAEIRLNAAYGALQQAVAQDFGAFAEEQGASLDATVEHMRAIAESAARGADEASSRAVEALRVARMELEQRVTRQLEQTRAHVTESLEDVQLAAYEAQRKAEEAGAAALETSRAACEAIERRTAEQAVEAQENLQTALDDVRVFAYDAARRADEAAARAIETLRTTREAIETGVAQQGEELRARMQSAFADAADRLGGLTERVVETEAAIVRSAQQLNARIIDVEDKARTTIDAAAEQLRGEVSAALAEMLARQRGEAARLNLIDAAISNTTSDVTALRGALEERLAEISNEAMASQRQRALDLDARLSVLTERIGETEQEAAHTRESLGADIARIEACAFAALDKMSQDIAAASSAQKAAAENSVAQLERGLADGRDQIAGVLARLRIIDGARTDAEHALAGLKDEIAALAAATASLQDENTKEAFAALQTRVDADLAELRTRSDQALKDLHAGLAALAAGHRAEEAMAQKVEELRARLAANEGQTTEAIDRLHGLARTISRITAQSADASDQTEDRLHKLELALGETRLDRSAHEAAHELAERLAAFERRQADALDGLRAGLARFMAENERRLSEIEQNGPVALSDETLIANAIEARLTALEQDDFAPQLEAMRHRVEERLAGIEGRSVRALEQVAETMAQIERRYSQDEAEAAHARTA